MKEKKYGPKTDCWYRSPKTTQERRWNYAHGKKYVRAKRYGHNLPNSYDDIKIHKDKCWKSKRKNQYRTGKRGKRHEIILPAWMLEYYISSYLEEHDIPYTLERLKESEVRESSYFKSGHYRYSWDIGTRIVYWTDKEIRFPDKAFGIIRYMWYRESVY